MGHRLAAAFLHGQTGLGAVQGLYLALLIDGQDQRVLGRMEVESDDSFQFLGEGRIVADLPNINCGFRGNDKGIQFADSLFKCTTCPKIDTA
jgi:hypothetical protein